MLQSFRMNVLIAVMADSYEMVKEHEKVEALHERAKMIADMELQHPGWHTYSEFMHVCEAADEESALDPEWAGITGRVKVLLADATEQTSGEIASVKDEVASVARLQLKMQHGMEDIQEKLQAQEGRFERLDSTLDGINSLLSKLIEVNDSQNK